MRTFCTVILSALLGSVGCGSGGDDEPTPPEDAGLVPDGPVADAPVADAPVADAPAADAPAADAPAADAPVGPTPPAIVSTVPADGDTDVDTTAVIEVGFDRSVSEGAATAGFQLLDELGQPVPGRVEVEGAALRFVPADELALLGVYTAVVTTTLTAQAGALATQEQRFQFQVRSGAWDPGGTLIEDRDGHPQTPDVAMDARGNVIAVWAQRGSPYSIWVNHYDTHARRWQGAEQIECDDAGDALVPRIAMDAAGNAIVVWQQSDGTRTHVWASRYDGTGWSDAVRLDVSETGDARAPRIAMNGAGTAGVVWRQIEGTTTQAWFNRFEGNGWRGAEPVYLFGQPASLIGAEDPEIGIDGQGNARVLLYDRTFRVQAVPHLAASGWGEADTLSFGPIEDLTLAVNSLGTALGLWVHAQPSRVQAWRREPDGSGRFDVLMVVSEEDRGSLNMGDVTMNEAGNSLAVWFQDSPWPPQVWANSYSPGSQSWDEPQGLLPYTTWGFRNAQVAMDPRSHAHAAWIVDDGSGDVLMMTRRQGQSPFREADVYPGVEDVSLAVNAQGKAVVIRAVQTSTGSGTRVDLDAVLYR